MKSESGTVILLSITGALKTDTEVAHDEMPETNIPEPIAKQVVQDDFKNWRLCIY